LATGPKPEIAVEPVVRFALSAREISASTGISYQTINKLMRDGQLLYFTVGTHRYVAVDVLRETLRSWTENGSALDAYDPRVRAA
jgi:hypothetical protein